LKPGVSIQRAQNEADSISSDLRQYPIQRTAGFHIRVEPLQKYLVADVRQAVLSLIGASLFLLLIACANVANLLLVRASLREREFAVRAALGGTWWRLVRHVLVEALLLAACGTALGVALAWVGIRELISIAPASLPRISAIGIDWRVIVFAALTGVLAAAMFGLMPAIRASRPDAALVLRTGGRSVGFGWSRTMRNSVVVAEVALSFGLLIGSGLMLRSFIALQHIDPGFDAHHMLTYLLLGGRPTNTPDERAAYTRNIESSLRSIPGVEGVTAATPFPLAGGFSPIRWGLEAALADNTKFQAADVQIVLPGYFETIRTPLIAGRTFTEADNSEKQNVVVVDQFLAAKAFGKESAVGKRILIRIRSQEAEWVEIVGVVAHQRVTSLATPGREQVYVTDGFLGHGVAGRWGIRTQGDPARYEAQVRAALKQVDPQLLMAEVQPMDALMDRAQAATRFSLLLLGVLASIAALLAAVGLYGVLSTLVRQRTSEIGVRMALGAAPGNIFKLIVSHGLRLTLTGIAVGLLAAFALTRVMTSMLVGVKATDPVTFAGMAILFFVIAAIACWLPARRAAGLDPTVALRDQ
jgi:putative ABC transport system permease protein